MYRKLNANLCMSSIKTHSEKNITGQWGEN